MSGTTGKTRYIFIDVLKAIGALLVLNSHFDGLYPIAALGTGGSLGDALFFVVSGFLLWPIKDDAAGWAAKKMKRIYIPVLLMTIFELVAAKRGVLTVKNAFYIFIWPTRYWFAGGILLFYLLYYVLRNVTAKRQFAILFAVLAVIYAAAYLCLDTSSWVIESGWKIDAEGIHSVLTGSFKLIYYFALMMIGKYVRIYADFSKASPCKCILNAAGGVYPCMQ